MRKLLLLPVLLVYLLGLIYLWPASPAAPDLPNALRSDEPGDTWQNPTQKAFFTDMKRSEAMSFYQNDYVLKIGSLSLPVLRLNYRPEDTAVYVRRHIDTFWLEEIVHPLRESLFISGWTPKDAALHANPDISEDELNRRVIVIGDQIFETKITLRWYESSRLPRLLVWTLIFPLTYLVFGQFFANLLVVKKNLWA